MRADASVHIGSGHVMRCLTLAQALTDAGLEVHFVCRAFPGNLIDSIRSRGFAVHSLPLRQDSPPDTTPAHAGWLGVHWAVDARECLDVAGSLGPLRWILVDHYALDARWEAELAPASAKVAVIDDLTDRPHDCNLLLNQNLIRGASGRYTGLVPQDCRVLLGPAYALLRPEFREHRRRLSRDASRVGCALVFLGGGDPGGTTLRLLELLEQVRPRTLLVRVVVSAANPYRVEIERRFGAQPGYDVRVQAENMAELMADADVSVGAGGTATWERCCVGLPTLLVALADNQVEVATMVAERGAGLFLGIASEASDEVLTAGLRTLLHSGCLRKSLSDASLDLVDGDGCRRVAAEMLRPEVAVRPARSEDAPVVFPWRNAEATRRFFHDPRPLTLAKHVSWFDTVLRDERRVLLIGEAAGRPVGVLRYDLDTGAADVSIYLDPAMRGRGIGRALLLAGERWLCAHRPGSTLLRAEVRAANTASRSAFAQAGFEVAGSLFEKRIETASAGTACRRGT